MNIDYKSLLHGQFISFLITGTGIFASILSNMHPSANFPLLMNTINYFLIAIFVFLHKIFIKKESHSNRKLINASEENAEDSSLSNDPKFGVHIWVYVLAAFLDVEANFLVLLAYNYTSITSVMLLDCFTIPCAMFLSYTFLGCRYSKMHYIGILLCLMGLICIVINDSIQGGQGRHSIIGDILCLFGASLYAVSNVLQETIVKFHEKFDYLGSLGGFGTIIALVQCLVFDLHGMSNAEYNSEIILSMFGFVFCLFSMYIATTFFLQHGDAIIFNLSLLTSDVYAVLFTYFFYGYLVNWVYFLAFGIVMTGLIIYHNEKPPILLGEENGKPNLHPILIKYFFLNYDDIPSKSYINSIQRHDYNPILEETSEINSSA